MSKHGKKRRKDRSDGDSGEKSEGGEGWTASLRNRAPSKTVSIAIVMAFVVLGFAYMRFGRGKSEEKKKGEKKSVSWRDEVTDEELEEMREYEVAEQERLLDQQERKSRAGGAIESKLQQLERVKFELDRNAAEIKKVGNTMETTFGDNSASYDEDITAFEQEQSFDTAFMVKSDLDNKRKGMVDYTQQLSKKQQDLVNHGHRLAQEYQAAQHAYASEFGQAYMPRAAIAQNDMHRERMQGGPPRPPSQQPMGQPMGPPTGPPLTGLPPPGRQPGPPSPQMQPGMDQAPAALPQASFDSGSHLKQIQQFGMHEFKVNPPQVAG